MRRIAILASIVAVCVFAIWQAAEACGDKFLLVGRGAKFQRAYASVYPGSILIYAHPSLGAKAAIRDTRLHKLLRQAGHAVSVIEDASLFDQALRTVPIDIVLVDLTDAQTAEALSASSSSHPTVVPVRPDVRSQELDRLQQKYMCKLKASDNSIRWLDTVEDAMKARVAARRAQKS